MFFWVVNTCFIAFFSSLIFTTILNTDETHIYHAVRVAQQNLNSFVVSRLEFLHWLRPSDGCVTGTVVECCLLLHSNITISLQNWPFSIGFFPLSVNSSRSYLADTSLYCKTTDTELLHRAVCLFTLSVFAGRHYAYPRRDGQLTWVISWMKCIYFKLMQKLAKYADELLDIRHDD